MSETAVNYSCPNCGGKLVYNADSGKLFCEWCASEFDKGELSSSEDSNLSAEPAHDTSAFESSAGLYVCDSCGAQIIADDNTAASFCCYCHSPVALSGRLSGKYCPEKVIPFSKTKDEAIEGFKSWCGKKWFLPSGFKSSAALEKITGMYVPFWLADCRVHGKLAAKAEIATSSHHGNRVVTRHKEFLVNREINLEFLGVPADGSKKLDDTMMDALEPFDYSELRDFSMTYLQGFYADKYDVTKEDVLPRLKARLNEAAMQKMLQSVIGYTKVVPVSSETDIVGLKWHYMMLPVWLMCYKYQGKDYFYAMNGQTGKFTGIMPLSVPKVILGAIITALLTALIGGAIIAFL